MQPLRGGRETKAQKGQHALLKGKKTFRKFFFLFKSNGEVKTLCEKYFDLSNQGH
jgi:hypothetical protein